MRYKRAILSVKVYGGLEMEEMERQLKEMGIKMDADMDKLIINIKKTLADNS